MGLASEFLELPPEVGSVGFKDIYRQGGKKKKAGGGLLRRLSRP